MCGWNPMQCDWGSTFFVFGGIYPHSVVMESHFSCFKKTHPPIIGIQVQSNNTQHLWICVHVFMCVVLLVSIVLGVDLVMDDMIYWFWKSAFGTMFELVGWRPCETFEKSLIEMKFINLVDHFNNISFYGANTKVSLKVTSLHIIICFVNLTWSLYALDCSLYPRKIHSLEWDSNLCLDFLRIKA
jgi:hypothetical protein